MIARREALDAERAGCRRCGDRRVLGSSAIVTSGLATLARLLGASRGSRARRSSSDSRPESPPTRCRRCTGRSPDARIRRARKAPARSSSTCRTRCPASASRCRPTSTRCCWIDRARSRSRSPRRPVGCSACRSRRSPATRRRHIPSSGGGYIAYSASGTATGQAVFVNYGLPADYAQLNALGVSVKDRIAIARYGRSHRAVKVHTAQEHGARALVLYSDPADDGEAKGPVWPDGLLARPRHAAARQRQAELVLARRPAHARRRCDGRCAASRPEGRADAAEDSRRGHQRREATHVLAALGGAERPASFRAPSTAPRASARARPP